MFIEFRKRIRRTAAQTDLLEPIIQLVQSFLTSKEAAQTTILSKSGRGAWLTRPNLDFDLADFCHVNDVYPKFLEFVEKTLERYENSNIKIDSFRLWMQGLRYSYYDRATNLVRRALKLGPTRLTLDFEGSNDFHIPNDVFRYESLFSLTAMHCRVNLKPDEEVCCSRLRSLSFEYVEIKHHDMILGIISSCPLIEKLSLCHVNVDDFGDALLANIISLHTLTSLVLSYVNFDTLFPDDLSSKFPSLKDLINPTYKQRSRKDTDFKP